MTGNRVSQAGTGEAVSQQAATRKLKQGVRGPVGNRRHPGRFDKFGKRRSGAHVDPGTGPG